MDWNRKIDVYCERTHDGFWAEPLNAWTNLAFLVAAAVVWAYGRRRGRAGVDTATLALILVGIGGGSFAFHTFATPWAGLLDVGFIALFVLVYVVLFALRVLGWRWWQAGLALVVFIAAAAAAPRLCIGGLSRASCSYLPPLFALAVYGLLAGRGRGGPTLLCAAGLFVVSLTARSLDGPLCDHIPIGTHFLWHVLNAVVLGAVAVVYVKHGGNSSVPPAAADALPPRGGGA